MDGNNARRYDAPGSTTTNTPTDEAHKRGLVTGLVVGIIGGGIVGGIIGAMLDDGRTTTPSQVGSSPARDNRIYGTAPSPDTTQPNQTQNVPPPNQPYNQPSTPPR